MSAVVENVPRVVDSQPVGRRFRTGRAALVAVTALAPASWGTTYLVTTELLPPGRPLLDATLRALPAGLVVLALTRTLPRGIWWWRAAVLGVLNFGAFFGLLFLAAYRLPGGVAATVGAVGPLVVMGLAMPLLGERPGIRKVGWGVVGVVGVALVVLGPDAGFDVVALLAVLVATVGMSLGTVLVKRWGRPVPVLTFAGWQLTAGGVVLLPVMLAVEGLPPALDLAAIGGFVWMGLVGTLLAYVLWFRGIGLLSASSVAFLGLLSPLVATVLGWAVLGQALDVVQVLGLAVALAALVAGQRVTVSRSPRAGA